MDCMNPPDSDYACRRKVLIMTCVVHPVNSRFFGAAANLIDSRDNFFSSYYV